MRSRACYILLSQIAALLLSQRTLESIVSLLACYLTGFSQDCIHPPDSSSRRCRRGERRRRSPRSRPNRPCKRGKRLRRNRNEPSASGSSDNFVHIKEVDLPIRIHKCLRVVGDVNVARLPRLGRSLFCLLACTSYQPA
jgi:hypothetical protein